MKKTNNPKISVVMSAYNSEKYLSEAIESILNQTFKDFEFIIFEDGSTDKTKEILKEYEKKDKRIVAVYNKKNIGYKGFIRNLNRGIKMAKGKYIARMDSDDISLPNRLQVQYDYMEKNPEIYLIGTGAYIMNEEGKIIGKFKPEIEINKIKELLKTRNSLYHPTIMFRNTKRVFYREKMLFCEDYDFYLNIITLNLKITNINEFLLKYRISSGSISHSKRSNQVLISNKAKEFYLERIKYGKDSYNLFDVNKISNLDIENSKDKEILSSEIKASFKVNDFKKVRNLCKKYFKYHGYFNKIISYYFASFFGKRIINLLRKVLFN